MTLTDLLQYPLHLALHRISRSVSFTYTQPLSAVDYAISVPAFNTLYSVYICSQASPTVRNIIVIYT